MFWLLEANMLCATTELANLQFQTLLGTGFMRPRFPYMTSPPHRHLLYELYFVHHGQCTTNCDGQDYTYGQSDILLVNRGTLHNTSQVSEDADVYSILFSFFPVDKQDAPLYSRLLSRLSSPILLHGQEHLLFLLNQLRQECALKQPLYDATVDALLQLLYAQLLRSLLDIPASDLPQLFPIAPPTTEPHRLCDNMPQVFYMAVLDSFFNHLPPPQKATLTELSKHMYVSVGQIRRLVKQYYGVSFQEKLIQTKLERSQLLMATTDLSLKAVAEQAGYGSYNAFFEAFTAHTGQTPSQYRQACCKK